MQNILTIHVSASCSTHYQCTNYFTNAEHTALSNKNDSLLFCRYLMLPTMWRQDQKVKSNTKAYWKIPLCTARAGFRGPRRAAHASSTKDSPTTPCSEFSQHRHAAPHSPHSEVAFMWKAGASQYVAKKWNCRVGWYIQFSYNLFW